MNKKPDLILPLFLSILSNQPRFVEHIPPRWKYRCPRLKYISEKQGCRNYPQT